MGENVWDFRKRLTLLFGSAVIIAVVFFIFKVLFYYVWPFMLAFCFAVLLQKPIVGLAKLLREKKTLAASIVVTMVTLIILSVLLYVGYMAFRELKDFIANFDENINSLDGQFKLVCCRIDGWIKLKEGCSYAFFEKCKGTSIPIYITASIVNGAIPILSPIHFDSIISLTKYVTIYKTTRITAFFTCPKSRLPTAHGISTVPVPNIGSASIIPVSTPRRIA